MITFNHFNFNVLNLDKSLAFYKEALGLQPVREKTASDGSFKLVYLGDGVSDFTLELTWLKDRTEPYNLGECEFHLAFHVDDYEAVHRHHEAMGCICFEILPWASILSPIRTATGSRSCPPNKP
jgi:lactoylglutathione lyase